MNPLRKGTDYVIKAFDLLVKRHSDIKLIIHTQANLQQFFPDIIEIIDELINTQQLEIIEKTVSAPGLYHLGDVYVYPSRLEGIGLTIAEALSCGLPIVTSDNAPMNEFVSYPSQAARIKKFYCRQDAYYWPICEVNSEDLAKKMEFFIENKKDICSFKKLTREHALEVLNWKKNGEIVNDIFTKSEILPLNDEVIALIDKKDNGRYPLMSKYPLIDRKSVV